MANSDKQLTAKQVATAVLEKVGELLHKSELIKSEELEKSARWKSSSLRTRPRELGVNKEVGVHSAASSDKPGRSQAGRALRFGDTDTAKEHHQRVLGQNRLTEDPNLPKSEEMTKDEKIRIMQKDGLSPNQIEAKLKKSELVKSESKLFGGAGKHGAGTGHEKGVHGGNVFDIGSSIAGIANRVGGPAGQSVAISEHKRKLHELKGMPKPNLPKSEEMTKNEKIRSMQKDGLSPNQIEAKLKKDEKLEKAVKAGYQDIGAPKESGHERGIHVTEGVTPGMSNAGRAIRHGGGEINPPRPNKSKEWAHEAHKKVLGEMKRMPSPNLPKSEDMEKAEGYKPQNSKKENAKPSEHNSKDAMQHADGPGPKGEIHPKEKEAGDPTNETRPTPGPGNNPKENAEGNNELAGTTPTQVGQDGKNKPGYDEMKGHLKLAKFIGRMEHKRSTKDITGAQAQSESTAQHKEVVGNK